MTPRGRGWEGGRGEGNGARPRAGDGHAGRARRVERIPWACQRRRAMARAGAYHGRVSAGGRWRERAMAQAATASTVAGSQRLTWLQTDLNPSGDKTVLVNQNLYFHLEELACVMQARGACKLLPSRGARKLFPSRGACDSLQFLGDIICTSQKHHVINNEKIGSEIGLHFRFKAPLIIQTNNRSGGLLFWRFRHKNRHKISK